MEALGCLLPRRRGYTQQPARISSLWQHPPEIEVDGETGGAGMNWYEKAILAANRIDPGHTSPWKLASTYALLSIAQSLVSQPATPASLAVKESGSDLLTVNEVAEMTRLTPATLRWWRSVGHSGPKSFKLGRRVLYRRSDVEKWMQDASE